MLILIIVLFYVVPVIISIIGEIYTSHYHPFFNDDLKEKLKNAKTVGDYLNCFQLSFIPLANIGFIFIYICIFLSDFLKHIIKITKLDILWKKIMNIKIRK